MATRESEQVERIRSNVAASLARLAEKGVTVPEGANSDALPELIESVPSGGGAGTCTVTISSTLSVEGPMFSYIGYTVLENGEMISKILAGKTIYESRELTIENVVCGSLIDITAPTNVVTHTASANMVRVRDGSYPTQSEALTYQAPAADGDTGTIQITAMSM